MVEELELPVRGCRGTAGSGQTLSLTLNVDKFVLTGNIARKRYVEHRASFQHNNYTAIKQVVQDEAWDIHGHCNQLSRDLLHTK